MKESRSSTGVRARAGGVLVSFASLAVMAVVACSSSNDEPASPPMTIAERCAYACATPTDKENPCNGQTPVAGCQEACAASAAGKSDDCASCIVTSSGWHGTSCSCANPGGLGSVACSKCDYAGPNKSCGVQLIDKCTDGEKTCTGFVTVAANDPQCAARCGLAPDAGDPALLLCQAACTPPTDKADPCNKASAGQVSVCLSTCAERIKGKSDACANCYASHSPWSGQSCSCSGGACTSCNWYGNVAGSKKACAPTKCSEGSQCQGFFDIGLDDPACASLCGVPPRDAGGDAATDDASDASSDDAGDASTDG